VETLAATLPKLVSSLVLAVRGELVPLLLYTISKHKVRLTQLRLPSSLVLALRGELVPLLLYTISKHRVRITLLRLVWVR
jgi:hypothetical protein